MTIVLFIHLSNCGTKTFYGNCYAALDGIVTYQCCNYSYVENGDVTNTTHKEINCVCVCDQGVAAKIRP